MRRVRPSRVARVGTVQCTVHGHGAHVRSRVRIRTRIRITLRTACAVQRARSKCAALVFGLGFATARRRPESEIGNRSRSVAIDSRLHRYSLAWISFICNDIASVSFTARVPWTAPSGLVRTEIALRCCSPRLASSALTSLAMRRTRRRRRTQPPLEDSTRLDSIRFGVRMRSEAHQLFSLRVFVRSFYASVYSLTSCDSSDY